MRAISRRGIGLQNRNLVRVWHATLTKETRAMATEFMHDVE
jgi:hypothetical protein